jgi:putative Mg2+ transporter-C (MgtC) family protein
MHALGFLSIEPSGQTLTQLAELALALVLSSLIGLEREFKLKSAGLRTHTLVGVAAALIMLVSKYGFTDVLARDTVILDPSRVAAQIVSGIGFIGGGLIFVQRDVVRGLTTAAIIWLTAAVGMACGAGLPLLAVVVTAAHFLVVDGYGWIARRIHAEDVRLHIQYLPGKGAVEKITQMCTGEGFAVNEVAVQQSDASGDAAVHTLHLRLQGRRRMEVLLPLMGDIKGVVSASMTRAGEPAHPSG